MFKKVPRKYYRMKAVNVKKIICFKLSILGFKTLGVRRKQFGVFLIYAYFVTAPFFF